MLCFKQFGEILPHIYPHIFSANSIIYLKSKHKDTTKIQLCLDELRIFLIRLRGNPIQISQRILHLQLVSSY